MNERSSFLPGLHDGHRQARRVHRTPLSFAAMMLGVFATALPALAQLPSARLNTLFPPGGKAGSTVEITVAGADLDAATGIRFSDPGITAKPFDTSDSITERKFTITIGPDVAPGLYEARVIGKYGLTNPRGFAVGDLPESRYVLKNGNPCPFPPGSTVNGQCSANNVDEYALELKQGQHVVIDCQSHEIDSRLLPVLLLNAPDGREVGRSRHGEVIDFTAPEAGSYPLHVHDLLYRGGAEYFYRITARLGPYVDAIFPPAGLPGSKGKYTLLGRNLPGGKATDLRGVDGRQLQKLDVEIELPNDPASPPKPDAVALLGAAGAGMDAISYRLKSDQGVSNAVLIGFARAPVIAEQEPLNNQPKTGQKVSVPCEVVGRFYPHGDQDTYSFEAAKGDVYWIEVYSERFGLPTSPELVVQKVTKSAKGDEQVSEVEDLGGMDMQPRGGKGGGASAGFPAPSRDVECRLEAKDTGVYRVTVRDLFNESTDNAALIYRLSIHKELPDFRLLATTSPIPDPAAKNANAAPELNLAPPFLRKAGVAPIRVNIFRKDGFNAPVTVEALDLPTGVHCTPAVIEPEETFTTLMLVADEKAESWSGTVKIVGKATLADKEVVHAARAGALIWPTMTIANNNVERSVARLTDEMTLAVSADETELLTIDVGEGKFEAKPSAKVHIPVKIKRRIDLKAPLKLQAGGLPVSMKNSKIEATIAADASTGAFDLDLAPLKLAPGSYTFYLQVQVPVKYDRNGGVTAKAETGGKKGKKGDPKETPAIFYSAPITLKILPK